MKRVSLFGILVMLAGVLLSACAPAAQPQMVEVTRIVAGTPKIEQVVVTSAPEEKQFRIAVIMPSSLNDLEWSQSLYEGLLVVQKEMGGPEKLEIAVSEDTWQVPDAAAAARDYAAQGYELVIMHGAQ